MTANEPVEVELFTQEYCAQCHQVAAFLRERGIQFVTRSVDQDPAALAALIAQGYMTTPVVRIGAKWIAGFRRKELEQLLPI